VVAVAFTASMAYQTEREAKLCVVATEGCPSTITVAGHELTYLGPLDQSTDARSELSARIEVDGREFTPGIQQFPNGNQQIGKPTVSNSARDSVLIALLDLPSGEGSDSSVRIRVISQPLIIWLWIGGGLMAAGAVLSAFPGRRRNPIDPVSAPLASDSGPDDAGAGDRTPVGVGT
jgi:cytochrome c-type biogenesis protein CcmF